MRIMFIGTVEFSLRVLEHLLKMNVNIVGVCTLEKSKINADHVDLCSVSKSHGIPCLYADDINSSITLDWIRDKTPDIVFCFGWSRLLKKELLSLAPLGIIGFHPASLPENRGRHPLIWSLVLGLKEIGSSFFFMDSGADSGDVISQRKIIINDNDDARTLYEKVTLTALEQIDEFVPQLTERTIQRVKQDERLANTWRKRGIADGNIDWRMSAHTIHNLVRGLTKPYIGAHFIIDGKEIKVWKTSVFTDVQENIEPGKVLPSIGQTPLIKCGKDAINLLKTDPFFNPIAGNYL
jgi:methionyl-tRNA formyltransferase